MRDGLIFLLSVPLLYMSLRNGYVAYLLWGWAGLASIGSYAYGFMQPIPFVQIFALIALTKLFTERDLKKNALSFNRTSILFILYAIQVTLSAVFAYEGNPVNWEITSNMLKTILFCLIMPLLLIDRFRIHAFILMLVIGLSYHGLIDGLKFIASAGGHNAIGIAKFGDNNHYAMVLIMAIPLMIYAYQYSSNVIARVGFASLIPLTVFAVMATKSRGGLVTLAAIAFWFILTSKRKFFGLFLVALLALLMVQVAPDEWVARMDTIGNAGDDSSLMGRVGAWRISSAIALANPMLGGGLHSIQIGSVWEMFRNAPSLLDFVSNANLNGLPGRGRAAHSIYFEVLGDLGFFGLTLFALMILNALLTAKSIMRNSKQIGASLEWAHSLAKMLTISIIAYAIGGGLLSAAYFELPYIFYMTLEVLNVYVSRINSKTSYLQ